jgi:hypothetical protein
MVPWDDSNNRGSESVRYESRDVQFWPVAVSLAALLALLAMVAVTIAGLFKWLAASTERMAPSAAAVQAPAPPHELRRLRQREEQLLDGYGWVSREKRIVRIPMERAMKWAIQEAEVRHESQ